MTTRLALDRAIGSAIFLFGLAVIILSLSLGMQASLMMLFGGVLFISAALYLLFRERMSQTVSLAGFQLNNRARLINHIVFIASVTMVIWTLGNTLYYRPPFYFVLLSVAIISILVDIFCLDESKASRIGIVLFKTIFLSLILYGGIYYSFPGIYGNDPWWHSGWIQDTIDLKHLPIGGGSDFVYYLAPLFHTRSAMTQLLTGLSVKDSIFISAGIPVAISSTFIFLITRRFVNAKAGLLAALIVLFSDHIIEAATMIIPQSLSLAFFLPVLFLIFCRDRKGTRDKLVMGLLLAAIMVTHILTSVVIIAIIVVTFIGTNLYRKVDKNIILLVLFPLTLAVSYIGLQFALWAWEPYQGAGTFIGWGWGALKESFRLRFSFLPEQAAVAASVPFSTVFVNWSGHLLLVLLAIIGALTYLHPKNRSLHRILLLLIAGSLSAVTYGSTALALNALAPWRWYILIYPLLAILAAQALFGITSIVKGNIKRSGIAMLIVLAIVVPMTTNSVGNATSPFFFNHATRAGFTSSELIALQTLSDMGAGRPTTDLFYGDIIPYVIGKDKHRDMYERDNEIFILRNYYPQHPEWNGGYAVKIRSGFSVTDRDMAIWDYLKENKIDEAPLIYNSGNVQAYAISEKGKTD